MQHTDVSRPWFSSFLSITPRQTTPTAARATRLGLLIALIVIGSIVAAPSGAAVFTVGTDDICDFPDLHEALRATLANDSGGPTDDTIRLTRTQTHIGEFEIYDQIVTIRGGYESCRSESATGRTEVIRQPERRHFSIFSDSVDYTRVTLIGLDLVYTHPIPSGVDLGGSIYQRGQTHLSIIDSFLGEGSAEIGGGLFVDGQDGAHLRLDELAVVLNNQAKLGGGIACIGEGQVHLTKSAVVLYNKAEQAGGGIFLDGCQLYQDLGMPLAGVIRNTAPEGGGLLATGGARADLFGNILENDADKGGGILVEGEASRVIVQGLVAGNTATTDGAGIYARSQGNVSIFHQREECKDLSQCAAVVSNQAAGRGGGLYAESGATVFVNRARLADNVSSVGAVAVIDGEATGLHLENSVLVGNSGDVLIQVDRDASLRAYHLTVGDNHHTDTSSGEPWYLLNMPTDTEIWNTIFWDDDGLFHDATSVPLGSFFCLLVPDATIDPGAVALYVGDPDFEDEAARDFQLGLDSDAVDICRPSLSPLPTPDRAFDTRIVNGLADAGAFERQF